MEGEQDPFEFQLARELHMTVDGMNGSMTELEYQQWRGFYVWEAAERELERNAKKAGV